MNCSSVKERNIFDGKVKESWKVVDEVLDILELWCRGGRSVSRKMVGSVHEIELIILHNV